MIEEVEEIMDDEELSTNRKESIKEEAYQIYQWLSCQCIFIASKIEIKLIKDVNNNFTNHIHLKIYDTEHKINNRNMYTTIENIKAVTPEHLRELQYEFDGIFGFACIDQTKKLNHCFYFKGYDYPKED